MIATTKMSMSSTFSANLPYNAIIFIHELFVLLREGFKKKCEKVWSFAKPGGGGVSEGGKKPNCFFEKSIFQRVSRIILGPPKHVLHLVWSAYFISTAVRTALKVARTPQILGEKGNYRSHYKSKKE